MAKPKAKKDAKVATETAIADFVSHLSEEHRMLIALKAEIYSGRWEPMLEDLCNRLSGKPYIFKLASRIEEDIERIEQMSDFESEHGINLSDYIELP